MKIKEALDKKEFKEATLLAGYNGIDRIIKAVDVMEVPDIDEWLTEGVLLMTTFYSLRGQPERQIDVIQSLIDANAAGLIVKIGRYVDQLPDEFYALANIHNMPVISVPIETTYLSIISSFFEHNIVRSLPFNDETENKLFPTSTDTLQQRMYKYSELMEKEIVLTNSKNQALAFSTKALPFEMHHFKKLDLPDRQSGNHVYTAKSESSHYHGNVIMPIEDSRKLIGYVHVFKKDYKSDSFHKDSFSLLKKLHQYFAGDLKFLQNQSYFFDDSTEEGISAKSDLFNGNVMPYSNYYQFAFYEHYFLVSLDLSDFFTAYEITEYDKATENVFFHCFFSLVKEYYNQYMLLKEKNKLFIVISLPDNRHTEKGIADLTILNGTLSDMFRFQFTFYMSSFYNDSSKLRMAMEECMYLNEVQTEFHLTEPVIERHNTGLYYFLLPVKKEAHALNHSEKLLKPLIDYDIEHNADTLLSTVETYLNNNGNKKRTAEELFIHRRTLSYRLEKIGQLTGIDLDNSNHRLMLNLAINLYRTSHGK